MSSPQNLKHQFADFDVNKIHKGVNSMNEFKKKAITFSYDDGDTQDIRMIEIFNKYGLKGTFNLNSGLLGREATLMREGREVSHNSIKEADIKYDALRFLSYALKEKGDIEGARKALEQIPEIYFTKLSELAFLLTGKEKFEVADKQKWISFENLIQMMWKIAECYEAEGETEKAIKETQIALKMIELLGNMECFNNYVEFFNRQIQRMSNK